jgi:hypothetical protein
MPACQAAGWDENSNYTPLKIEHCEMTVKGQKQTFAVHSCMSTLLPKVDITCNALLFLSLTNHTDADAASFFPRQLLSKLNTEWSG